MVLAAPLPAADESSDDVRADRTDVPHEVAQDLVVPPLVEALLQAEGEPEVDGAREILLGPIEPVDGHELFGAEHAERLEDLGADFVLAAIPAGRRHEGRAHPAAVAHHREQRVVLVVGMRGGLHEGPHRLELAQRESEGGVAGELPDGPDP